MPPVNLHKNKSKTNVKGFKRDQEPDINPEFIDEVRELEKEPIIYVKDPKKHFKD